VGIFRGMNRRKFVQTAAAAGATAAAARVTGPRRALAQAKSLKPANKLFDDVELTYFQDSNWLHAPLWLSPIFMQEAGVGIKSREMYEGGDTMAKVLPQLLSRSPRFDWVQFPSLFFGSFAETGMLEPLDDYFAQYPEAEDYLKWVMPAYGEFYTKWNGQTYGLVLDGDIHVLHYRPSYFNDPALQKKF
jgi:ABC-type glycerol-3-phosphate transport system substrate-binding protein